ncbi:MAG: hypothetical protein NTU41_11120 [Chloroflexi bacterium]|nr:hypothetical protein [Chloroflexota bacterium]
MSITPRELDSLVRDAVFAPDDAGRQKSRWAIVDAASSKGVSPASIQGLYEASGKGLYGNATVPAINIRGITYHVARAVFRAALKNRVGAFIFEIARSEIGYTKQSPSEYAASVLAAAIREGFRGPVFLQGDHFQVNRKKHASDPDGELAAMKKLHPG